MTTAAGELASAVAAIDAIEDEAARRITVAPLDGVVRVRGWAIDDDRSPFEHVEVDVGGAHVLSPVDRRRPDVAAHLGSAELVGFTALLDLSASTTGRHALRLTGVRADGARVPIPVAASLDVIPALRTVPAGLPVQAMQGALDTVRAESAPPGEQQPAPPVARLDETLVLVGWAASTRNVAPSLAYVEIDGTKIVRGMTGYPRPDVAAQLGTEHTGLGYRIRVAASDIGLGTHSVRVIVVAGGATGAVGEPVEITIVPPAAAPLFERDARFRGRIDVMGHLDSLRNVREERMHLVLAPRDRAVVTGWAADPLRLTLPDRVLLAIDGVAHGAVQRGFARPDVAASTQCEALLGSGFSAMIRADVIGAGFHRAEIVAFYGDEPTICDEFSLIVTP